LGIDTIICDNFYITLYAGTGYDSYLWSDNSNADTLIVDSTGIGIGSEITWVEITDSNGCTARDSITITINLCTGINENNTDVNIKIFPNPGNNFINVELKNISNEILNLEIIDINGQVLFNKKLDNNFKQIDISSYSKGIYFVKLKGQDFIKVEKVIKY